MEEAVTFDSDRRGRVAWFFLGTLSVIAAIVAMLLVLHARPPVRAANLLLIYVGAEDCAPCRAWQHGEGAAFRRSADFGRLTYLEVKSPRLRDVLKDENWPQEIRTHRDHLKQSDGVPLWLVVSNDDVVERSFGATAWRTNILPTIRARLR